METWKELYAANGMRVWSEAAKVMCSNSGSSRIGETIQMYINVQKQYLQNIHDNS